MYTVQQIFDISMDLINKRMANGQIATNTQQYKARTPGILTVWQGENAKNGDYYETFEISNKPIPNILGMLSGFDIQEFIGTDLIFEAKDKARGYYFEVDGPCTAYIEDYTTQWNVLATITVPDTITSFTAYKGVATPSLNATKSRMRFTGAYYFRTVNRALFGIPLNPARVPDYRPWIKKEMPSNFKSVDTIIEEFPQRQYAKSNTYKWEGRRDLYINYYYEGNVRVVYKPVPPQITALTDVLKLDEITSMSAAYFLASHLILIEDPDSASFFNGRYEDLKLENVIKQPVSIEQIIDVYGGA